MCCWFTARAGLWKDGRAGIAAAPWASRDDVGHVGFGSRLEAALDLPAVCASCGAPELDRDVAADAETP